MEKHCGKPSPAPAFAESMSGSSPPSGGCFLFVVPSPNPRELWLVYVHPAVVHPR